MNKSVYVVLLLLLCQCKTIKYELGGETNNAFEKDKCYAECLVSFEDVTIVSKDSYNVYLGNESDEKVSTEIKSIILQESTTKWEKRKADRNCLSSNPDDCVVWCLVEVPEIRKEIRILVDTSQSNQFENKKIEHQVFGQRKEWIEVMCKTDITKSLLSRLQIILNENGYYYGDTTKIVDKEILSSLKRFQKDFDLPIGKLDFETLDVLGITTPD